MATLQQAIQKAKKDPASAFARELLNRLEDGRLNREVAREGINVETAISDIQPERLPSVQERRGALAKVAGFLGVEKLGTRLGSELAALTPQTRKILQDLPEETAKQIKTGGVETKEAVGSALLTALNLALPGAGKVAQVGGRALRVPGLVAPTRAIRGARAIRVAETGIRGAVVGAGFGAAGALEADEDIARGIRTGAITGAAIPGVTRAVGAAVRGVGRAIAPAFRFGTTQATGLSPNTIQQIIRNPKQFERAQRSGFDRFALANKIKDTITRRRSELAGTGREYQAIRDSKDIVRIVTNPFQEIMAKHKIGIVKGKIVRTRQTRLPLSEGDMSGLQEFQRLFGRARKLTADEFLNARSTLSEMAKFGREKTSASQTLARDLRSAYDKIGKKQIKGLKELDAQFSKEKSDLIELQADYINKKTGELKDGAVSKIANLTGRGKEMVLKRLKPHIPGIEEEINILKAMEDVEHSAGQKVGTYFRAAATGGFLYTGQPVLAVLSAIAANPSFSVPMLRTYGRTAGISQPIINNIINKLRRGLTLMPEQKQIIGDAIRRQSISDEPATEEVITTTPTPVQPRRLRTQ